MKNSIALLPFGFVNQTAFKAHYQIWSTSLCVWVHCEFYLFAKDRIEAKRLAVKYCRDNNGQPIDYYNLDVEDA